MLLTDSPVFAVGMMIAGLAAGTGFYYCRLRKENLPGIAALWAALFGSVLVLPCAKIGYLLHDLFANLFDGYFDEVLSVRPEHLSFIGGCLGFLCGVMIAAKISGEREKKLSSTPTRPAASRTRSSISSFVSFMFFGPKAMSSATVSSKS